MAHLKKLLAVPPRALGLGFWWMWIYLALMSPTFVQSPLAAQPPSGALVNFATIFTGAFVYVAAIPLARKKPALFQHRALAVGAAVVASCSTALMAFSALFGTAGSQVFLVGSLLSGIGISVLYLQWGAYYATLKPGHVTLCTVLSFLLAIVASALVLERGLLTTLVTIAVPLLGAVLIPFGKSEGVGVPQKGDAPSAGTAPAVSAPSLRPVISLKEGVAGLFPLSVAALIVAFTFAFGLFRVLLATDGSSASDIELMLLFSAGMAFAMLVIISLFSVPLGWDSIVYLALPLIAVAAFVLSVADFGDRAFVWAIIVAAVRVSDLITWMIFANTARQPHRDSITVFAVGKLLGQIGALTGLAMGDFMVDRFSVESMLLPTALAFLVMVTVLGSFAAVRGRMASGAANVATSGEAVGNEGLVALEEPTTTALVGDGALVAEQSAEEARIAALASDYGLSPRETEIFGLLAKGRTVPYIAEELTLANSTITTHVRGLYRKLNVHNRQELLDFVEQAH